MMGLIKMLINRYLPKLGLKLPQFSYFNYSIDVEYQQQGFAIGLGIDDIRLEEAMSDIYKFENLYN